MVQKFIESHCFWYIFCPKTGHQIYQKVVPLIPVLESDSKPYSDDLPNVLFVGIDSVSRLNFDRHFPQTAKLLAKHKFYTMFGYNKVADNTFVNLTPLLTGHYLEDIWNETVSRKLFLNYFPFIWKVCPKYEYFWKLFF